MDFMSVLNGYMIIRNTLETNGEITLLQSTDIYDNTPLDVYKDEFDVSKENSFLNDWIIMIIKTFYFY